jgi:hypothetical protein
MNITLAQTTAAPNLTGGLWNSLTLSTRGLTLPLAAIGLIILAVLIWAVFFRKTKNQYSNWGHALARAHRSARDGAASSSPQRRRRRRREHRPRNPTLAETGGLPPLRTQPPADPFR